MTLRPFLQTSDTPRAVILLSGSGTNARRLLESLENPRFRTWQPAALLTDAPETSAAEAIGKDFNVPVVALDIKKFYREHGETRVSLLTEHGREIREQWTAELRRLIAPYAPDFGILAGFIPLTNLTNDFPCLNVHPGDLRVTDAQGRRLLVGLHTLPIETAILRGDKVLHTSVIVAQPYTGKGGEMDSGPILGVSPAVTIDLQGTTLDELKTIAAARPEKRPVGGFKDKLEAIAAQNQELLKVGGDWVVFPPAVADFASGIFATDNTGALYCNNNGNPLKIKTLQYATDGSSAPQTAD